jgi:hypothetical protein
MGKHCKHPRRKVLARRRRLMFFLYDLLPITIVLGLAIVIFFLINVLLEGGR